MLGMNDVAKLATFRDALVRDQQAHCNVVRAFNVRNVPACKPGSMRNVGKLGPRKTLEIVVDDGYMPAYVAGVVVFYHDRTIWYDVTCNGNRVNPVRFPRMSSFGEAHMRKCADVDQAVRVYSRRIAS